MATLTFDPSETQEGELTEEEQNSLEVGEKMAEQQEQMLAGKFKTAEDLEQGYIELQKKLGEPKEEETAEPEEKPEAKEEEVKDDKEDEIDTAFLDTLWDEAQDKFTDDTLEKLGKMDAREVAQMHLKYRADNPAPQKEELSEQNITDLKGVVGGDAPYNKMMQWATQNLTENEVKMYDAVMDQGNPLAAYFAVQALSGRMKDAQGVDGELLTGKAPVNEGSKFKSQAQVVKAMNDDRYEKDPAYRQEIYDKLERSNLNF